MKTLRITGLVLAALLTVSCSEKTEADKAGKAKEEKLEARQDLDAKPHPEGASEAKADSEESERAPEPEEIGEDCVGFLRATKTIPANRESKDCPTCPSSDATFEVLKFNDFDIEKISSSEAHCEVAVTIRAQFNPSSGGNIVGGLTGWISPEQREQYSRGQTPTGEQVYKVKVIYKRTGGVWRPVEFARPDHA